MKTKYKTALFIFSIVLLLLLLLFFSVKEGLPINIVHQNGRCITNDGVNSLIPAESNNCMKWYLSKRPNEDPKYVMISKSEPKVNANGSISYRETCINNNRIRGCTAYDIPKKLPANKAQLWHLNDKQLINANNDCLFIDNDNKIKTKKCGPEDEKVWSFNNIPVT